MKAMSSIEISHLNASSWTGKAVQIQECLLLTFFSEFLVATQKSSQLPITLAPEDSTLCPGLLWYLHIHSIH